MIRLGIRGHDMGKFSISDFSALIKKIKSLLYDWKERDFNVIFENLLFKNRLNLFSK